MWIAAATQWRQHRECRQARQTPSPGSNHNAHLPPAVQERNSCAGRSAIAGASVYVNLQACVRTGTTFLNQRPWNCGERNLGASRPTGIVLARAGSRADIEEPSGRRAMRKRPQKANRLARFRRLCAHRKSEGNVGTCGDCGIDKFRPPSLEAKLNPNGRPEECHSESKYSLSGVLPIHSGHCRRMTARESRGAISLWRAPSPRIRSSLWFDEAAPRSRSNLHKRP